MSNQIVRHFSTNNKKRHEDFNVAICHCVAFSDYSAFDELAFLQRPVLQFLAAFAIVHLLRSMFFFRTISIVCRLKNFIQLFFYYSFDTANTRTATFFFNDFEAYQISSIVSMWTTANFFGNIANRINFNTLTIFVCKRTFRT